MVIYYQYFLCFVFYGFLGWLYESLFYTLKYRKIVNSGFLTTMICPIYGIGALMDVALLGKIDNTILLFSAGMIITCSLEYFVGWLLEEVFHTKWWDYSQWPLNIKGRVCAIGALAFGILTVLLLKFIHPRTYAFITGLDQRHLHILTLLFALIIAADTINTLRNVDESAGRLWFITGNREND